MRSSSSLSVRDKHSKGFTLIELMVVLGIILMILGILAPAMSGILKGKKVEQAISAVSAVLENARMEAVTQNAYVWVGFLNVGPTKSTSGQDEVWLMSFRVKPESNRPPTESSGTTAVPSSALVRVEGVSVIPKDTLPANLVATLPTTVEDFATSEDSGSPIKWAGAAAIGETSFTKQILFTPRGEAIREKGNPTISDPVPYTVIGIAQSINGAPLKDAKDGAAVLVSGFTGRITTLRP